MSKGENTLCDKFDSAGSEWIMCPTCESKTRTKVRHDTTLLNFPLFCPKCKSEILVNLIELDLTVIKEPDAKTQSR